MKSGLLTVIVAAAVCFADVSRASAQSVPLLASRPVAPVSARLVGQPIGPVTSVPANKHVGLKTVLVTVAVVAGAIAIIALSVPRT